MELGYDIWGHWHKAGVKGDGIMLQEAPFGTLLKLPAVQGSEPVLQGTSWDLGGLGKGGGRLMVGGSAQQGLQALEPGRGVVGGVQGCWWEQVWAVCSSSASQ